MRRTILSIGVGVLIALFALQPVSVFAHAYAPREAPFNSYVFNRYGRAVPVPASYMPTLVLSGEALGIGDMRAPSDITAGPDGLLYIADAGNSRFIILDSNFELVQVIDQFTLNGQPFEFEQIEGIFVLPDGRIHVADSGLRLVVTINHDGEVLMKLGSPESEMLSENFHFTPMSVLEDATGVLYILSRGSYQGALMIDLERDNLFLGFFGANQVQLDATQFGQMMWRRLFTREQRERMVQIIPVELTNFDICPNGFIYVCSAFSEHNLNQLRVLNSAGRNILRTPQVGIPVNYGDPPSQVTRYLTLTTSFIDITYMDNGLFAALDFSRGRVFVFNRDSHLVAQFGQLGDQFGRFSAPTALASIDGSIVVLDSSRGDITVFERTEYGELVYAALILHDQGRYEESIDQWRAVLARSINFELAYLGIGRGLARSGYLQESLWYLRRANNRQVYSEVFELYRTQFTSDNFDLIAILFIAFVLVCIVIAKRKFFARVIFRRKSTI